MARSDGSWEPSGGRGSVRGDLRGTGLGTVGGAVGSGGCTRGGALGQPLGGDPRAQAQRRPELSSDNVSLSNLIAPGHTLGGVESAHYIDGDDITRRYIRVKPSKRMRLDLEDWGYKSAEFFEEAKICQAGVGVSATLEESGARYPQSVYYYRVKSPLVLSTRLALCRERTRESEEFDKRDDTRSSGRRRRAYQTAALAALAQPPPAESADVSGLV